MNKLCQETQWHENQLLPIALMRIKSTPTKPMGFSPCDTLNEGPPPLIKVIGGGYKGA